MRSGRETTADALLTAARTDSPLRRVDVRVGGRTRPVWVKLEMRNPTGSVKYRAALGLLADLDRRRPLRPGDAVVESTSGNLGVALAEIAADAGWRFVAVVDPKAPRVALDRIVARGAKLRVVDTPDGHGGYLLNRLLLVRRMIEADPGLRWTDQYHSQAGPEVHRRHTAAEVLEQTGGRVDAVFAAVSTGGTVAGLARGLPGVPTYAVDVVGSAALGGPGHSHLLNGIGATRRSTLLGANGHAGGHASGRADGRADGYAGGHASGHAGGHANGYAGAFRVPDVEAMALCRLLRDQTGLGLGASSGAVLAGFLRATEAGLAPRCPVLISADGEDNYLESLYSDQWLAHRGVLDAVRAAEAGAGAAFTLHEEDVRV